MELTESAIPLYLGGMVAEHRWQRRHAGARGPQPADYERRDTIASLSMGVGSLLVPLATSWLLKPVTPGRGRYARWLLGTAAAAVAVTTVADRVAPAAPEPESTASTGRRDRRRWARRVASVGGVTAVAAGGVAITTALSSRTTADRLWRHRKGRDLGRGPLAVALAVLGWDFIYYWNHRFMHESRFLWAIHVVHHSSERYNLSTALRQPVADAFGTFVPYSLLCLAGIRPELISTARGVNLIYQYWIHTDAIRTIGPLERALNTPSHHRVHHGSNHQYLDRNHGSILIVWDRLFGTFEPEGAPVVYGLTKNIHTFNPARVASYEHVEMLRDVAAASSWRDRLSYVLRGPGWSFAHPRPGAAPHPAAVAAG